MRIALFTTLVLVGGVAALALAPAVEARAFCVAGVDSWCPGVFCKYDQQNRRWDCVGDWEPPIECVTEPCPCTCPPDRLLP